MEDPTKHTLQVLAASKRILDHKIIKKEPIYPPEVSYVISLFPTLMLFGYNPNNGYDVSAYLGIFR